MNVHYIQVSCCSSWARSSNNYAPSNVRLFQVASSHSSSLVVLATSVTKLSLSLYISLSPSFSLSFSYNIRRLSFRSLSLLFWRNMLLCSFPIKPALLFLTHAALYTHLARGHQHVDTRRCCVFACRSYGLYIWVKVARSSIGNLVSLAYTRDSSCSAVFVSCVFLQVALWWPALRPTQFEASTKSGAAANVGAVAALLSFLCARWLDLYCILAFIVGSIIDTYVFSSAQSARGLASSSAALSSFLMLENVEVIQKDLQLFSAVCMFQVEILLRKSFAGRRSWCRLLCAGRISRWLDFRPSAAKSLQYIK